MPTGYGVLATGAAGAAVIASGKVVVVLEGGAPVDDGVDDDVVVD